MNGHIIQGLSTGYNDAIKLLINLLPKERKAIEQAYRDGRIDATIDHDIDLFGFGNPIKTGIEYFNNTYCNEETN